MVGLCGGYQMLGHRVADPDGIEGPAGVTPGLGLLNIETTLTGAKTLREATGTEQSTSAEIRGFEMHVGRTTGPDTARPMLDLHGKPDGAVSPTGQVMGCYLHGLFTAEAFRRDFLNRIATGAAGTASYESQVETTLDALADHLERHVAVDSLLEIAGLRDSALPR